MVYENSSNSSQLDSWFNAVNSLNDKEWQAVSSYGVALVTSAAAGFISGMAVASGGIKEVRRNIARIQGAIE